MSTEINNSNGVAVHEESMPTISLPKQSLDDHFLFANSPDAERVKHRRTASMRSDIGSRRRQVRTPTRVGSGSQLDKMVRPPSVSMDRLDEPRLQRVRSFTKTSKGLVNRGDSIRRRNLKSKGTDSQQENHKNTPTVVVDIPSTEITPSSFRVDVLGYHKVGKSSLVRQFMTSEYMGAADTTPEGESRQSVSVIVDRTEANVDFTDRPYSQTIPEDMNADGYIVIYSLTDKRSYKAACETLLNIRRERKTDCVIILVANKNDLVRKRRVTEQDGKKTSHDYQCTYMETSAAICHNVDELLVKTVGELRKHAKHRKDKTDDNMDSQTDQRRGAKRSFTRSASGLLRRVFSSIRRPKPTKDG